MIVKKGMFLAGPLTEEKIIHLLELGVNEVSLSWKHCSGTHVQELRDQGVKVFAEISLFVGEELWQKYPDARPIDRSGKPIEPINWYHGVCPNHPGVRRENLTIIEKIIHEFDIDGIWLDFIRYPCHWEKERTSKIAEYCFCDHCRSKFSHDIGGKPEGKLWIDWKCTQITEYVKAIHACIHHHQFKKPIELGLFAVPWTTTEFDGAIKRIIGQDFKALSSYVDVFGIMAYHKITGNPPSWINGLVRSISNETRGTVIPLVQSIPIPKAVSPDEFASALEFGLQPPSKGLMVFHFEDMLTDNKKTRILKQTFQQSQ
jgi:uncharacterized lipoprotein YddW (UPF0748 family)